VCREGAQLQERRPRIQQPLDAITHEEFALLAVTRLRLGAAAGARLDQLAAQFVHQRLHASAIGGERLALHVDFALEDIHGRAS
jgi:hypothetical protein